MTMIATLIGPIASSLLRRTANAEGWFSFIDAQSEFSYTIPNPNSVANLEQVTGWMGWFDANTVSHRIENPSSITLKMASVDDWFLWDDTTSDAAFRVTLPETLVVYGNAVDGWLAWNDYESDFSFKLDRPSEVQFDANIANMWMSWSDNATAMIYHLPFAENVIIDSGASDDPWFEWQDDVVFIVDDIINPQEVIIPDIEFQRFEEGWFNWQDGISATHIIPTIQETIIPDLEVALFEERWFEWFDGISTTHVVPMAINDVALTDNDEFLNNPPVPEDDTTTCFVGVPRSISIATILQNDFDDPWDLPLTFVGLGNTVGGSATVENDNVIFTADGSVRPAEVEYIVSDGVDTASGTIIFDVLNTAPVAGELVDLGILFKSDYSNATSITIPQSDILVNASDVDNDDLFIVSTNSQRVEIHEANSTVTITQPPGFSFTPFEYTVNYQLGDGQGGFGNGLLRYTVDHPDLDTIPDPEPADYASVFSHFGLVEETIEPQEGLTILTYRQRSSYKEYILYTPITEQIANLRFSSRSFRSTDAILVQAEILLNSNGEPQGYITFDNNGNRILFQLNGFVLNNIRYGSESYPDIHKDVRLVWRSQNPL